MRMIFGTGIIHADTKWRICVPTIPKVSRMQIRNTGSADVLVKFNKDPPVIVKPKEAVEFEFKEKVEYFFVKASSGVQRLEMFYAD